MSTPAGIPGDAQLTPRERQDAWATARGWRPRKSQHDRCPRLVAGLRCLTGRLNPRSCFCQRHWRVLDHARGWADATGRRVLTAEPYGADLADLGALAADPDGLGLTARVMAGSPYYPGATVLVVIASPGGRP